MAEGKDVLTSADVIRDTFRSLEQASKQLLVDHENHLMLQLATRGVHDCLLLFDTDTGSIRTAPSATGLVEEDHQASFRDIMPLGTLYTSRSDLLPQSLAQASIGTRSDVQPSTLAQASIGRQSTTRSENFLIGARSSGDTEGAMPSWMEADSPQLYDSNAANAGDMVSPTAHINSTPAIQSARIPTFRLLNDWQLIFGEGSASSLEDAHYHEQQFDHRFNMLLNRRTAESSLDLTPARCVIKPMARPKIVWDVIAALLLMYDVVLIPMGPFNIPRDGFIFTMGVAVTYYWTLDIIANFFVGYMKTNGEAELRKRRIAKRYMRTWFAPDTMLVSLDWLTFGIPALIGGSGLSPVENLGLMRVGKLARFIRLLRVLRLVRVGKLQQAMHRVQDSIGFESTAIVFSLSRNVAGIMFINHIIACVWFWIGQWSEEESWLQGNASPPSEWYTNYLRALHWSIANFTPGSSGFQPNTTEELFFSVLILFFALVIFSVFVSSTTSLIQRLMGLQSSKKQQLWVLKTFLQQHRFDTDLRERVLRYVNTALGGRRDLIHRADVGLLNLLSQPLREEVEVNLHLRTLRSHPFFRVVSFTSTLLMRKISVEALQETAFSRGDTIFTVGEDTDKMGFVVSGILGYAPKTERDRSGNNGEVPLSTEQKKPENGYFLGAEDCFCEAVLWTKWRCRGTLHAEGDSDVLELSGQAFRGCLKRHPLLSTLVNRYATAFVDTLNRVAVGEIKRPLSDLQKDYILESEPLQQALQEPRPDRRPSTVGRGMMATLSMPKRAHDLHSTGSTQASNPSV